jgi:hypothetical protein
LTAAGELITAADGASITTRQPLPPPPPPALALPPAEIDDEEDAQEVAASSGLPDMLQLVIREAVAKAVPLIFEKLAGIGGAGFAGMPLGALFDWRKAVPTVPAASSAHAAPTPNEAPPMHAPPTAPSAPASTFHAPAVTVPPTPHASAPAGADASESATGAAPAEMATTPAASSPPTQEDAAAMVDAHVLQVWQGLSPPERVRAGQLIARLTAAERAAWIAELARFTVPEAIARVRGVLHAQPAPTPQLPTTPEGEPS